MPYHEKVKSALKGILDAFEKGDIPAAITMAVHPNFDVPMSKWSLMNRLIAALAGTIDARGYRQWLEVGRQVKKGTKSFAIIAPRIKKVEMEDRESDDFVPVHKLIGFIAVPVHRVEDTVGVPLKYEKLELPRLPLLEVAEYWGIKTIAVPGNHDFYGSYRLSSKEIHLASPEELVFFHELAHAAHDRFSPLEGGQHWHQEIVAELSAACLCRLVGKASENLGNSHRYISVYADEAKLSPFQVCMQVLRDVERVVNSILETSNLIQSQK